jgi:hypothetical protein
MTKSQPDKTPRTSIPSDAIAAVSQPSAVGLPKVEEEIRDRVYKDRLAEEASIPNRELWDAIMERSYDKFGGTNFDNYDALLERGSFTKLGANAFLAESVKYPLLTSLLQESLSTNFFKAKLSELSMPTIFGVQHKPFNGSLATNGFFYSSKGVLVGTVTLDPIQLLTTQSSVEIESPAHTNQPADNSDRSRISISSIHDELSEMLSRQREISRTGGNIYTSCREVQELNWVMSEVINQFETLELRERIAQGSNQVIPTAQELEDTLINRTNYHETNLGRGLNQAYDLVYGNYPDSLLSDLPPNQQLAEAQKIANFFNTQFIDGYYADLSPAFSKLHVVVVTTSEGSKFEFREKTAE